MGERSPGTFVFFLSVPGDPQSLFSFPASHPPLQGWLLPDKSTEGEFSLPLPESEMKIQCENIICR